MKRQGSSWIKGLRILIEEGNQLPWYARFFWGDKEVSPELGVVEAIEQAVAYDEKGRPAVVLGRLPHSLQAVFPAHTWAWEEDRPVRVPVRAGRR